MASEFFCQKYKGIKTNKQQNKTKKAKATTESFQSVVVDGLDPTPKGKGREEREL